MEEIFDKIRSHSAMKSISLANVKYLETEKQRDMLTDFKGFNSVIYSTSYIAELCEKEEDVSVNRGYSHVLDTKIPTTLERVWYNKLPHLGMFNQSEFISAE